MLPYEFNAERLSRWMAYVLRHNPSRYGLRPDEHGYVDFDAFLLIATRRYPDVNPEQLRTLITTSNPTRFEVTDTRVRARYGHSIPVAPAGPPVMPPPQLYHGIDETRSHVVLAEGLKPVDRRLLHLSDTRNDAVAVARRKTEHPILLQILAQEAHQAGIVFYREGNIYLASHIPASFLKQDPVPAAIAEPREHAPVDPGDAAAQA